MVGLFFFFFDLFSHSGLRAFFTSDFANCTTNYAPAQKINPKPSGAVKQQSDGWVNFFLTSSPILDLGHFSQVILPIVLQIMPQPKNNPTIRCCEQHLMVGVNFFLTSSPILDLGHFSQVILPIVLQAICPTIRCRVQHLMVGFFVFFWLLLPFWT